MAALAASSAEAASVAYTDKGEVWLSSLDGTQKARLAGPVVNGAGETEEWLDVAQSDGGRIVAVRNKPGRMSNFSWFKVWEADGTSTVEGPLNAPSGWTVYVYPLGFDVSADGSTLVYGYSNSSGCCPISFDRGTYVRPVTNSLLSPITIGSQTHPSLLGARMVTLEDSSSPKVINVQNAGTGNPYNDEFTGWLDASGVGLDLEGIDVAANGQLAALGFETWEGGSQTVGRIGLLTIQGVDQPPAFPAAVDCFLPATGIARDASLSQDAMTIAWQDDDGLKTAGTPNTSADPCVLTRAPALISATGAHPSIGGADVGAFLPKPPPTTNPAPGTAPTTAPIVTLPAKVTAKALAGARGVPVRVKVGGPGRITVTATVPARRLGRRGKAVVVARGAASAAGAGTVTIRLKLTATGRKRARRLRGARLTLRIVHGSHSVTKKVSLH